VRHPQLLAQEAAPRRPHSTRATGTLALIAVNCCGAIAANATQTQGI